MKNKKEYSFEPVPESTGKNNYYENRVKKNWNLIRSLLIEGLTEAQVANSVGVALSTWNQYKVKYPEFRRHIDTSRRVLIADLEASLFQRALGVSEEKVIVIKQQYNKYSDEWIDIERQVTRTENKTNNTLIIAALKFLSEEWRRSLTNNVEEDREDITDVIESIGTLIEKIKEE